MRIRDALFNADFALTQAVLMAVFGKLQAYKSGELVAALAFGFLLVCQRFGADPRETLAASERILRDARDKYPENLRALELYCENELEEGNL